MAYYEIIVKLFFVKLDRRHIAFKYEAFLMWRKYADGSISTMAVIFYRRIISTSPSI